MSNTIDEKVVEMRFDNKNFETNIKDTMKTLEAFKKQLQFSGASEGLEEINNYAKKMNFNGLTEAVDTVKVSFSALEVMAITALTNITNSAVNAGKRIISALTIDPIKTGFNEYEQKMDAVRVIMASAGEAEGKTLDEVTAKIQELNKYADDTIYSFSDMTTNIGKFTNAGVKLDDAVLAIKGISNEAARSGANAQEASRAMYNFAQALSMGYVQLIDWKSIENANMATVEFKNTLLETAIATGKVTKTADGMYKTGKETYNLQQMFKDGLKDQWLTSDILIDTLKKYADETTEFGQKMYDAAKQVTTVSKLWDTLKEAAQSGWGQTWELIVGNLDEARVVLTNVSNVISNIINQSAEARNAILKEWRELGGRNDLIEAFKNIYKSISSLLTPIKEAFREIFPKITGKDLANLTKKFKEFTSSLIINEETAKNIKETFKGLFSVLKVGTTIMKSVIDFSIKVLSNFKGLGSFIFSITGSIGKSLSDIYDVIVKSGLLINILNGISNMLISLIQGIRTFTIEILKLDRITDIFRTLYGYLSKILSSITKAINDIIKNGNLKSGIDIINGGILGGLLLGLKSFVKNINNIIGDAKGSIGNIKDVLSSVKDILKAYQQEINSKTLMNIAKAIGILTLSLWVLSTIDEESLGRALSGMAGVITELMTTLFIFMKMMSNKTLTGGILKGAGSLIAISTSLLIIAGALKILSTLSWDEIWRGLVAMGGALAEMIIILSLLRFSKGGLKGSVSMLILANSLIAIGLALKILATLSWDDIKRSLTAMGVALAELVVVLIAMRLAKGSVKNSTAMLIMVNSLIILSGALKILATMNWDEIWRSISVMGIALAELTATLLLLRFAKGSIKNASSILIMVNSMIVLAGALKILATMNWDEIWKSITAMGIALAELTATLLLLRLAKGSIKSSASILIMANSMVILAGALKIFSTLSIGDIAKSLITIALALGIFGGAAALLTPVIPAMLGLAAAIGVFGLALVSLGAGLTLIGTGFGILKAQIIGNIDLLLISLKALIVGFVKMIPEIILAAKDIIIAFCDTIIEAAPKITETFFKLLLETLKQLNDYIPDIISELSIFIIKVFDELAEKIPKMISGFIKVLDAVLKGFKEAINELDPSVLAGFIENAKSLSVIFIFLAGLSKILPAAMKGVIGFGLLVVELGAVMSMLGALSKIPGLNDIIKDGGGLLETVGNSIGKFVGGLIGGIGNGISDSLPDIATNLSKFMNNLSGFIEGAKHIDADVLNSIKILSEAIITLTAADLLQGITKFLGFGKSNNLEDFGKQLEGLGTGLNTFVSKLTNFDDTSKSKIEAACEVIKLLGEANNSVPNSGGLLSKIIGDNKLDDFGKQLEGLGKGINSFVVSLKDFSKEKIEIVKSACDSIFYIADLGNMDLNTISSNLKVFGDNLIIFGYDLEEFLICISNIGIDTITQCISKIQELINMATNIASINIDSITTFSQSLVETANNGVIEFCNAFSGFEPVEKVKSSIRIMLEAALSEADNKKEKFKTTFTELMKKGIEGVESKKGQMINVFKDTCKTIIDNIRSERPNMVSAGEYFADGFANGINNNAYKGIEAARNMAIQALIATRQAIDSNSPSKETQKIGNFFGEGFVNGIKDYFSKIYNTAFNTGELAKNGLNEAISKIKYIINNDMDFQPRITPILDLSNIRSGINDINSMFNYDNLNRNLNAISNVNIGNQNRRNDDVVSAINKLSDSLDSYNGNVINIYPQELDKDSLNEIVDEVNRNFGKVYK